MKGHGILLEVNVNWPNNSYLRLVNGMMQTLKTSSIFFAYIHVYNICLDMNTLNILIS